VEEENLAARARPSREQTISLVIGLAAASLLGALIGLVAYPQARPAITAMTLVQLAITALGLTAPRRPVIWAIAVAVACLGSALTHPVLSELAYSGATPWIGLATAAATLNLYRSASDWSALATGSAALVLGCAGLVAVSIRAGVPAALAIMAASVYILLGVLAALMVHLRNARDDRVRQPELLVDVDEPVSGGQGAIMRALAIVALRSDELLSSSQDLSVRRTAADLRDVARRALVGPSADERSVARIEVHPPADSADSGRAVASRPVAPMPDLPEREREILRLVATGASNASIGRSLYLSEATVKQYVSKLMQKFDRENRTQLALMAAPWFPTPDRR
jgi:DNA-binding CsgD family transcriptional regulator